MKLIVDVNLPPAWVGFLRQRGFEVVHWTEVGDANAKDVDLMRWARDNGYVVFTHDLDLAPCLP